MYTSRRRAENRHLIHLARFFSNSVKRVFRLIRARRVGVLFYDLPIKFRSVRIVELLFFQLRGII